MAGRRTVTGDVCRRGAGRAAVKGRGEGGSERAVGSPVAAVGDGRRVCAGTPAVRRRRRPVCSPARPIGLGTSRVGGRTTPGKGIKTRVGSTNMAVKVGGFSVSTSPRPCGRRACGGPSGRALAWPGEKELLPYLAVDVVVQRVEERVVPTQQP